MAWALARVSSSSAWGSESATMPTPAQRRASVPFELGGADADGPAAVAGAVDPADRSGVAAPVAGLEAGDERQGRVPGVAADGGRGVEGLDQLQHRGGRVRQLALDHRPQVLDVGHADDRGRRLLVEERAPRQEGLVHEVDGDLVLGPVLGRGQQPGRQLGVGGRIAAPGGRAREGVGAPRRRRGGRPGSRGWRRRSRPRRPGCSRGRPRPADGARPAGRWACRS